MNSKILMTGGSGLLGRELQKYIYCYAPPHVELDITKEIEYNRDEPELIIHCAGYTDVVMAEKEKEKCFKVNFFGTKNLVDRFINVPIVYISTEYIYNPVNFYTYTKYEAEKYIRTVSKNFMIIRTLFKPNPFPYEVAFTDQYTRGDYVDVIAPLIVSAIVRWDKVSPRIYDVGTERKTIFDLAKRTRAVMEGSVDDVDGEKLPKDYK